MQSLIAGFAAYASAEAVTRIIRLVSIIVIARFTTPAILGTAALALSLFELVRVLANAGIGQRIIVAAETELDAICNMARRLFWLCCALVALVQLGVAAVLGFAFGQTDAAIMLAVLSAVYLIMPPGLVQIFLLMREGRLAATARIGATQTILDHILTMVLVVIWPVAWAIVLPKLLTAPVWTLLARRAGPWSPNLVAGRAPVSAFRGMAGGILLSEMMTALRAQADKLIVGALFGTQMLGVYYFAFNAGLGIAQSLVTAFGIVLFPHLSKVSGTAQRLIEARRAVVFGAALFMPLITAQSALAPLYVPVLFGDNWASSASYVAIMALGGLPLFTAAALGALYRANQTTGLEAKLGIAATIAALGGLVIGAQFSLTAACWGYVLGMAIVFLPRALREFTARPSTSLSLERIIT